MTLPNSPIEKALFDSFKESNYPNFIGFVKRYLAPYMEQHFEEEDYYKEWFDIEEMTKLMQKYFKDVRTEKLNNQFVAWIVYK